MATVVVLNGHNKGEWYSIGIDRPLVVGRDASLLAEVLDPRISHRHLEVYFDVSTKGFRAMDLQSRNGTKVDGHRCRPWRPLQEGSEIRIGHTVIVFTHQDFESYEAGSAFFEKTYRAKKHVIERVGDEDAVAAFRQSKAEGATRKPPSFSILKLINKIRYR